MIPTEAINVVKTDNYLKDWSIVCDKLIKNRIAECDWRNRKIILSVDHVLLNDKTRIELWVKHEIAHALVGNNKHDKVWQKQAILLGIEPLSYDFDAICPVLKYKAICPKCNKIFYKPRKPSDKFERWCIRCGRIEGKLIYFSSCVQEKTKKHHDLK